MGSILASLSREIYAGFRGKLLKGVLWRPVVSASSGLDVRGDPLALDPVTYPCQGFTDKLSNRFKGRSGVQETDSSVNVFAASLPPGIQPLKDDKVNMPSGSATWWQLRMVDTDPATALWVTAAFQVKAPE